ncbi:rhodanese-related sulfurtransferase [Hamadaea flava]|uniref:Rhodanese-like domain-containing protein n=1 Tax=Hamadaea flava TaxID=1742688 RepID=A0ABV8LN27_9ACTN|nr:rhodanese-like domain-containing protein [Hamadaea flava]MCP2323013.1 rhodanese-related sulfurtransferase [Hamadaea flava]
MSITKWLTGLFAKPYRTVSAAEAQQLQSGGAILLDVREKHEWRAGHAPKARHIPLGQLSARSSELPAGRTVVTVCQSGMRSAQAARYLAAEGREVANLSGGMHAWSRAGLPVTR